MIRPGDCLTCGVGGGSHDPRCPNAVLRTRTEMSATKGYVILDPVEQICSMLAWAEDWSEEYKRERLEKAIRFVMKEPA